MYTYRGAYLNALAEVISTGMNSDSVYLWTVPMFHCNGWCFPWAVTAAGATHVTLRQVDPPLVWDLIARERVTHLCAAPTVLISLANHPSAARQAQPVRVATGGAPADGQTMGEVLIRGKTVMAGYFQDEAGTAEAFRGGWFHSGDLGVLHPDGYVELRDRAKDIIISGGENISTIEVEQVIVRHPAVLEAAVIGVPDAHWGAVPKAFVTLK